MVNDDIIATVSEPTKWVSSLLLVSKPGKLRICMDPRDLNQAIRREHYQMPTIEEIATRLSSARVFTVVDAKMGFGRLNWTMKQVESQRSTRHSDATDRSLCRLAFPAHLKFGRERCTRPSKDWMAPG